MTEVAAESVLLIVMLPLIVVSTDAWVPPNTTEFPFAVPETTPPFHVRIPVPITFEFAPAAPTDCTKRSNSNRHAAMSVVTVPTVSETPNVVAAGPHAGVIIAVPPVMAIVPPARTQYTLPAFSSFAKIGVHVILGQSASIVVAVSAPSGATGGSIYGPSPK